MSNQLKKLYRLMLSGEWNVTGIRELNGLYQIYLREKGLDVRIPGT